MSRKLFQHVSRFRKSFRKDLIKNNAREISFSQVFKIFTQMNILKNKMGFLNIYLNPQHQSINEFHHKFKNNEDKQQVFKSQNRQRQSKDGSNRTRNEQRRNYQDTEKDKQSIYKSHFESLKQSVDWKKHVSELKIKIEDQKKKIVQQAQNQIAEKTNKLKQSISNQINQLQQKNNNIASQLRTSSKQQRRRSIKYLRQKAKHIQERNQEYLNQKMSTMEDMLRIYKKKISQNTVFSKQRIVEKREKAKSFLKSGIEQISKTKIQFFRKIITKIFWRLLLLIAIASFAYGLGRSSPRLLRQILDNFKKTQKQKSKKEIVNSQEQQ